MSMQKILERFDDKFAVYINTDSSVGQSSLQLDIKQFLTQAITKALNETVIEEKELFTDFKEDNTDAENIVHIIRGSWNKARSKQIELIYKFINE